MQASFIRLYHYSHTFNLLETTVVNVVLLCMSFNPFFPFTTCHILHCYKQFDNEKRLRQK
ncbi:hypothetical protein EMUCRT_0558 [Ehrlichia cf. muris str. EmCRT]|uniref:Uncharacterized protein n=1 Tax=Ehrlichia cf. muris str. EmCRT TaxID=1359167 RepID=A0A0F3NC19_9RICK|nr:hypothetical protein EMUCRT_0558 [Ehrlichia cf. muris str. EmCRT]